MFFNDNLQAMDISYILTPLIGGVIGYITNDVAIKMLFHPHKAKYVMGHRIPFTPGIIPKEKARIASSLGDAISVNLMNREVLERTLLSEEMLGKLTGSFDRFCESQKTNAESVLSFAGRYLPAEDIRRIAGSVAAELEGLIAGKLADSQFGNQIAGMVIRHAVEKTSNSLLGVFGAGKIMETVSVVAEPLLARQINEMIGQNAGEIVHKMVEKQSTELLHMPMCAFFAEHDEQIAQARSAMVAAYKTVILEHLPRILSTLNISQIVEQRINEMDMAEIEPLIYEVMDKELKAIIWLGAGLGALIGCVNLFL